MRRTPLFFAFAGLELVRYLTLAFAAQPFAVSLPLAQQMLRLVAAPNLLFAVGFFFMGLDARRYGDYRPLLIVGKAVALFSSLIALPRLFGGDATSSYRLARIVIPAIALWDATATAVLLLRHPATQPAVESAQTEPERIEVD
ncbi:MAG TPA: hypothetical protein VMX33_05630 [bacterium]|nr:hypothetical protein [bacterium]